MTRDGSGFDMCGSHCSVPEREKSKVEGKRRPWNCRPNRAVRRGAENAIRGSWGEESFPPGHPPPPVFVTIAKEAS